MVEVFIVNRNFGSVILNYYLLPINLNVLSLWARFFGFWLKKPEWQFKVSQSIYPIDGCRGFSSVERQWFTTVCTACWWRKGKSFFCFTGRAFFYFPLLEQLPSTNDTFLLYYGTGCLSTRWRVRAHRCADHNNTDCKYHSWQSDRHWESKLESWGRKKMSYLCVRLTSNRAGHILRTWRSTTSLLEEITFDVCIYLF